MQKTEKTGHRQRHNPFSTRNSLPGSIPYHFEQYTQLESSEKQQPGHSPISVPALLVRLRQFCYLGQIVGPHGSGKSTLLAALMSELEKDGHLVIAVTLHDRQRSLPWGFWKKCLAATSFPVFHKTERKPPVFVIDGYEQLSYFSRSLIRLLCYTQAGLKFPKLCAEALQRLATAQSRRLSPIPVPVSGLLVTTHTPVSGLPILHQTATSLETLKKLVRHLMRDYCDSNDLPSWCDDDRLASLLVEHQGNLREIFFVLYDRYEETQKIDT